MSIAYTIGTLLSLIALVFVPVGRLEWKPGWIFVAFLVVAFGASALILGRVNPTIYRARSRFQPGTKRWDLVLVTLILAAMIIAIPLATFDAGRMGWSYRRCRRHSSYSATPYLALGSRSAPGLRQSTPSLSLASESNTSAASESSAKVLMPPFTTPVIPARS
jgi:hypothetical protein